VVAMTPPTTVAPGECGQRHCLPAGMAPSIRAMTSPPRVRPARIDDLAALHALDEWPSAAAWQRLIGNSEVVVLDVGGTVVGLAHYAVLWTTVPFLSMIVLHPGHRGRGYSRMLLDYLGEQLRAQGYVALLSSSQTDEPEPQAWHRHLGFTSGGIIENIADDGIGEVVFRLEL